MAKYFDIDNLKRDVNKVKKSLKIIGDTTVATAEIRIMFPVRFTSKGLCTLDRLTTLACYYCIIDKDNNYAITNSPVFQVLKPDNISIVTIGSKSKHDYIILKFEKDSVVVTNNNLIQDASILYSVLNEFYINGNFPWYMNYEDIANIFIESKKYTGNDIGNTPVGLEIFSSLVSRDTTGIKLYKDSIKSRDEIFTRNPVYVKLEDVLTYDDTGARLVGGYLEHGITSSIVDPETKTSDASELLRK